MIEIERPEAFTSRSSVTSLINRAETPQALCCSLTNDAVARLLPFDYCSLVLPESDGAGIQVWRASRRSASERLEGAREAFAAAHGELARALSHGASTLIPECELLPPVAHGLGEDARAALALPLSFGGVCFGLLCFSSRRADLYCSDDGEKLQWLADMAAAAATAILARTHSEALAEKLGEMEHLKSGFANTLVRDMRFPLTNVLGLLELFESKLLARETFDTEDRQLLTTAIESGDRMRALLDNLLEITEQKERPLVLDQRDANVEKILEDVAEPLRGEAALRGVELNVRVLSNSLSMHVDERHARRAIQHILRAALDATTDGGAVRIEAQSIMGARTGDDGRRFVAVNIIDSGAGIPAEEIPFVFDAFWQPAGGRSTAARGLGLAIARRIVAAHGGNVSVRSQCGVGTTYSIVLPATQPARLSERGRILIVDDAPELLLLLRKLVVRMGYEAETASDGYAALRLLREKSIDLVLTDWAMPGMNGGELIATMKREMRLLRNIPTIVLTGHDTDEERREAKHAGCDHFLVKPVKRDDLQRTIDEAMRKAECRVMNDRIIQVE
jgi:signal transduction histidine kinase/CheY-like chemotaxis protein